MSRCLLLLTILVFISGLKESRTQNEISEMSHSASIAEMENLLKLKQLLMINLRLYIIQLQNKLDTVNNALEQMQMQLNEFTTDSTLSKFSLMRHLYSDWPKWLLFMKQTIGKAQLAKVQEYRPFYPDIRDLSEAARGIIRLTDAYKLKPQDVASGLLDGRQYSTTLDTLDCYVLGIYTYLKEYYDDASKWLELTVSFKKSSSLYKLLGFKLALAYQVYSRSLWNLNIKRVAVSKIQEAVLLLPHDVRLYRQWKTMQSDLLYNSRGETPKQKRKRDHMNFDPGCRGEFKQESTKFHCHYDDKTQPFLRLAPLKVEQMQLDPYIVVYHDVLYDSEIEDLKQQSVSRLYRSFVVELSGRKTYVWDRLSKSATHADDATPAIIRINQRVVDMTGFDIIGSDNLQTLNYGIGGQYGPHYDFFNMESIVARRGDRIATVLFYLNDVPQGGATVFPLLNLSFFPKKGSALLWYNLDNALTPDQRTRHGGCPVLFGSKWACTKWIYSLEQTFIKPCKA